MATFDSCLLVSFPAFAPDFSCYLKNDSGAPLFNECPNNEMANCAGIKYHSNYTTLVTEVSSFVLHVLLNVLL